MPELEVIGRAANPESVDVEPVIVPVVAYRIDTGEEVIEKFPFKPTWPLGALALSLRAAGPNGEVPVNSLLACLERMVMPDARERWTGFLDSDDLAIERETLGDVFRALMEHYAGRPTRPPSGSPGTGKRSGRTSKGAARSKA